MSASECWAVGYYNNGSITSTYQTLIERWDGTSWAIVSSPNTSTTQDNLLYGVTCVSASDCWAVGSHQRRRTPLSDPDRALGRDFVDHRHLAQRSRTTQFNFLYGVTCVSASDCWAVGYIYTNGGITFQTLIEHWDGTAWAIVSSPNTSATQTNVLYGVTCVSASDCWAVGDYMADSAVQTLIERWIRP